MPDIKIGESRSRFVSRCVPIVMKEGKLTQKQAVGKCTGLWNRFNNKKPKSKTEMKAINEENIKYF